MLASEYPPCHTQSFDFYHAVFVWLLKKVFSTEMVEKDEVASKQNLGRHPFSIKIKFFSKKHPLHAPIQLVLHQIISQTSYILFSINKNLYKTYRNYLSKKVIICSSQSGKLLIITRGNLNMQWHVSDCYHKGYLQQLNCWCKMTP